MVLYFVWVGVMSRTTIPELVDFGQSAAMVLIAAAALVMLALTGLAAVGVLPWLQIAAMVDGAALPWAGMALQIGLTVLLLLLSTFIPSNRRVLQLEASHRAFALSMDDISRAYEVAHKDDRAGAYKLKREFDSVRERYMALKDHPDLEGIDSDLLTIAAQMSHQSRELAQVYSDDKIARVTEALDQRKRDATLLADRIQTAHAAIRDVRGRLSDVEIDEASVAAQLERLEEDMDEITALFRENGLNRVDRKKKKTHLRSVGTAN